MVLWTMKRERKSFKSNETLYDIGKNNVSEIQAKGYFFARVNNFIANLIINDTFRYFAYLKH